MTVTHIRKHVMSALTFTAIILFALGLVLRGAETSAAAVEGLKICVNVLIPSLFPFFVVSSLAVKTGLAGMAGRAFARPMRLLFGVSGSCAPAFVLGLVGGYPVGAKTAIGLYESGLCTKTDAERLLAFCNNSGPAFILGAAGTAVFGGTTAGALLYASHVLASVAVGVIFRWYKRGAAAPRHAAAHMSSVRLTQAVTSSITSSFVYVINICAFVIFFSVAIRLLTISGAIPLLARALGSLLSPLGLDAAFAEKLIAGLFEVSGGVYGLKLSTASLGAKLSAAAFMLGWAGLSVHCQVLNFIGDSGLSAGPYIVGKLLHAIISAALAWLGFTLLPFDAQVSRAVSGQLSAISALAPAQSFALALASALSIWGGFCLIWAVYACKKRKKKL